MASLAESGFDPLARTCQFMLTEEAHHMFVGETGVMRIIQRTCEVMRELRTDDPERSARRWVIDLPMLQRFMHFHYSVSLDLFGRSSRRMAPLTSPRVSRGRYHETRIADDHR